MPRLSDRVLHVDAAAPARHDVHRDRIEPLTHRPTEKSTRCRG